MKKTFITLAALAMASVASADVSMVSGGLNAFAQDNAACAASHYVDFTIDKYNTLTMSPMVFATLNANKEFSDAGSNSHYGYALQKDEDGTYTLTAGRGSMSEEGVFSFKANSESETNHYVFTAQLTEDVAYRIVMSYSSGVQKSSYTLSEYDTHIVLEATEAVLEPWIQNGYGPGAVGAPLVVDTHSFAASAPPAGGQVPEPATATLSLLAFAGLAARRRRK